MNSGMDTVSISTKSALPNSRFSCCAMVPVHGRRWARRSQVVAIGPPGTGQGPAASSGEVWAGLRGGDARAARGVRAGQRPPRRSSARSGPARLWAGAPGGFRSSRGGCRALWGPGHRDGDGGGWSRLWPWSRCPCPARASQAPPLLRSPPPPRPRPPPPHLGGAHARGESARRAGPAVGRQRPLEMDAGIPGGPKTSVESDF